ncbi:uncharacterized protein A4U43_C08F18770 [Asparagus officinalis]|nr:uncharacterized protein A4U43_C08F18770 [Asparagus officinalis]
MATFLHGESRRMYSWWWDSHISPKNSKWLQENLTDMDRNIKAMIKLIEEDADSFARRAEMYYKKRPELMKLVEEFYRAYRALAERYDHATGALRQAHRTMAEAFPNQIPPIMSDESPSSSGAEIGPHTPEMAPPMRAPLDPDDLNKDVLGVSSHFHGRRRNGAFSEESNSISTKKGLKQLIPSGEGKVRKVLSFKDENGRVEEIEDLKNEIRHLQEDVSQLTTKNENLMSLMASESQHARTLEETISKLESMKEAAAFQYNLSIERISSLENDISNTRCEISEVNDAMVVKLNSVEEQCLAMEKVNRSLQLELETQQRELAKRGKELEELNTSIEVEHKKRMQVEVALMSLEQIHTHSQEEAEFLVLEKEDVSEKLKEMELSKVGLEEKITELDKIIGNLHEQNILSGIKIKELQDEIKLLKETKGKLENELGTYLEENRALLKEVCSLKEGNKDLEQKHQGLTEQIEVVSDKNVVLENSLSDANVELEGLREKAKALEASCETLLGEVSTHVVEKGMLVSQLESISQNMERVSVKNFILENSLSDANVELKGLKARFEDLEQSSASLCDQNCTLLSEKNTLVSQIGNLEHKYFELQDQHKHLEKEKDSRAHQVMELQNSFQLEKQEYETRISSLSSQVSSLNNQIHLRKEEIQAKAMDFEMEQRKVMSSLFHIFILQRCLCEMNDKNLFLSGECQNLLEASKHAEGQISKLKWKEFMQKKEITSLSEHNDVINKGIHMLLEAFSIDVKHNTQDGLSDEVLAQFILPEVKKLLNSVSDAAEENKKLQLEVDDLESKYLTLQDQHSNLERQKDSTVCLVMELESSLRLKDQEHEALVLSFSSQLASLRKQVHLLEEEIKIKDEDLEVEQQKTIKSDLENFVLCRCLCDMKDDNLSLFGECQNLLEELKCREKKISELINEDFMQKKELTLLSNRVEILRDIIHSLFDVLNIDMKNGSMDNCIEEVHLQIILDEARNLLSSVSDARDENQCLHLEVEIITHSLETLQVKYSELEERNLNLESEKDSAFHQVSELESSLKLEKHQYHALKSQLSVLQKENQAKEVDFEMEQQKTMTALLEMFILQRCLNDMKEEYLILSVECQNLLEASKCSDRLLSELKHDQTVQNESNDKLRSGILVMLEEFNINNDCGRVIDGSKDEVLVQTLQGEIKSMLSSLSNSREESQCLHLEISVFATLLKQIGLEKDEALKMNEEMKVENISLLEENQTLSKRSYELKEKLDRVEGENSDILAELLALDHLFIFFKALSVERGLNLKLSSNNMCRNLSVKNGLDKEIRLLNQRILEFEMEAMNLKELALLQDFEMNMASNFYEEINLQLEATENDLFEARQENALLCQKLDGINKDFDNAMARSKKLEKEIKALSSDVASKDKETTDVIEINILLHKELDRSNQDIAVLRRREEHLSSELQKGTSEIHKCEGEIETLLKDIQISTVNSAIFEEKILELIVTCESLEILSTLQMEMLCEDIALKNACIDEFERKLRDLEGQHNALKANFNAHLPMLMTLFDGIACLEAHILSLAKLVGKQDDVASETSETKKSSNRTIMKITDLQKLIAKLEALQNVIIDTKNLVEQERMDSKAKIEATRKEIEELKLKDEISKEKYGQKMKDIQLDQVSRSDRPNKSENSESDDQMLELWETAEIDDIEAIEEVKSEYPSSELIAEKEFSIDKLEVSTRVNESSLRQWNKKFIQKLDSDARRLSVAQRSLRELKTKLESTGKKKHAKSSEYDNLKVQVAETEAAILEQVEVYEKLKKRVEDDFESSNAVIWEKERRRISEEARKGLEQIDNLELEVEKIEYVFLKVEEEEEKRIGCVDRRSSILLSEYIYGKKKDKGKRKGPFCRCMRPKTKG